MLVARHRSGVGLPLYRGPARRFVLCLCPALLAGGVLTAVLYQAGESALLPGVWLLLYGCAVLSATLMTAPAMMRLIGTMGALFVVCGALAFEINPHWHNLILGERLRPAAPDLWISDRTHRWYGALASMKTVARRRETVMRSPEQPGKHPRPLPVPVRRGGSEDSKFDRLVYERVRLGIMSALAVNAQLTFNELKALFDVSDGNLSAHARKLEEAGYIACSKSFAGRRPKSEYRLTPVGRQALYRYLEHIEAVIKATRRS